MVPSRELLDLIAEYVAADKDDAKQDIAQRFDVALSEAIGDRASMQSEA